MQSPSSSGARYKQGGAPSSHLGHGHVPGTGRTATSRELTGRALASSPSPPAGSPSAGRNTKLDRLTQNLFTKAFNVIVQSRVLDLAESSSYSVSRRRGSAESGRLGKSETVTRRSDRWFNLELDDVASETHRDFLRPYKTIPQNSLTPFIPPSLQLQIYLDVKALGQYQTLSLLDAEGSKYKTDLGGTGVTPRGRRIMLEVWDIRLAAPQNGSSSTVPLSDLPTVYKKCIILFRSLQTVLRLLPSYRLFRRLRKMGKGTGGLRLGVRVVREGEIDFETGDIGIDVPLADIDDPYGASELHIGDVSTPVGTFQIHATYRNNVEFAVDDSERDLSSQFMDMDENYFTPTTTRHRELSNSDIGAVEEKQRARRESGSENFQGQEVYANRPESYGRSGLEDDPREIIQQRQRRSSIISQQSSPSSPPKFGSVPHVGSNKSLSTLAGGPYLYEPSSMRDSSGSLSRKPSVTFVSPFKPSSATSSPSIQSESQNIPQSPGPLPKTNPISTLTTSTRPSAGRVISNSISAGRMTTIVGNYNTPSSPSSYSISMTTAVDQGLGASTSSAGTVGSLQYNVPQFSSSFERYRADRSMMRERSSSSGHQSIFGSSVGERRSSRTFTAGGRGEDEAESKTGRSSRNSWTTSQNDVGDFIGLLDNRPELKLSGSRVFGTANRMHDNFGARRPSPDGDEGEENLSGSDIGAASLVRSKMALSRFQALRDSHSVFSESMSSSVYASSPSEKPPVAASSASSSSMSSQNKLHQPNVPSPLHVGTVVPKAKAETGSYSSFGESGSKLAKSRSPRATPTKDSSDHVQTSSRASGTSTRGQNNPFTDSMDETVSEPVSPYLHSTSQGITFRHHRSYQHLTHTRDSGAQRKQEGTDSMFNDNMSSPCRSSPPSFEATRRPATLLHRYSRGSSSMEEGGNNAGHGSDETKRRTSMDDDDSLMFDMSELNIEQTSLQPAISNPASGKFASPSVAYATATARLSSNRGYQVDFNQWSPSEGSYHRREKSRSPDLRERTSRSPSPRAPSPTGGIYQGSQTYGRYSPSEDMIRRPSSQGVKSMETLEEEEEKSQGSGSGSDSGLALDKEERDNVETEGNPTTTSRVMRDW